MVKLMIKGVKSRSVAKVLLYLWSPAPAVGLAPHWLEALSICKASLLPPLEWESFSGPCCASQGQEQNTWIPLGAGGSLE